MPSVTSFKSGFSSSAEYQMPNGVEHYYIRYSPKFWNKFYKCHKDKVFVLSAVSPTKMFLVLQNLKRVLKPNGHVLLRDYAVGDFAQVKLQSRKQIIAENFYFREDGTMGLQGCGCEYLLQTYSESL